MHELDTAKQSQYNIIFFSTKILALFFCAAPLYQYFFKENSSSALGNINFAAMLISIIIILIITFMWIIIDQNRKRNKVLTSIEIIVFYSVCLASVMLSGEQASYYKFMFIFIVVSYTIEFGFNVGFIVAIVSSLTVLAIDLVFYNGGGLNPFLQTDIAMAAMFMVVAWTLGFYVKIERQHIEDLRKYANVDGLTDVYNHRYLHEELKHLCDKCIAQRKPISFIMIDIDYFKTYNDLYGHQLGDEVLKKLALLIKENTREKDVICRYGGEEFAIILPDTTQKEAVFYADRLRTVISDYPFEGQELLPNGNLTVSIGVAELLDENDTPKNMINRADTALYRAKFFRKNRVEIYTSVFTQFEHLDKKTDNSMLSVKSLITIINSRDRYTSNHTDRVVWFCDVFANYLNLDTDDKRRLIYGAYLHDIGKINVSKSILISDKKLTPTEWEEMKKHSSDSAEIIRQMDDLDNIVDIVLQHHEKYDGSGYPHGLKGEAIDPLARMLTLADSFDAMTTKRPYQEQKSYEEAFSEIQHCKGTHFDPVLAEKFIIAINESI